MSLRTRFALGRTRRRAAPETAPQAERGSSFVPGRNCWRVERAERFRCVQDGAEYFALVREAILRAERSIFILGWDIAAGVDLLPGVEDTPEPKELARLLDYVVRRRRDLHVYVLTWDYAALYALERDPSSRLRLGWQTHERVHFRYDDQHPWGASHHQKVVVVDDRLAFSGGLDLTGHRWDTVEHAVSDPLRKNARGQPYTPFHDVQALVEGPVATSLGELARERWRRRGRTRMPPIDPAPGSLWPAQHEADLTDVDVAIARTEPRFRRRSAVRECEQLFYDMIERADRCIYIENQYFTSEKLGRALAQRLREPQGPELIVVGPRECTGWLEQKTMGALRQRVLAELVDSDRHGRLRLLHPLASRAEEVCTFVHSKVTIVDDEILRIGSANLTNRSMGMDTECDIAVSAGGNPQVRQGIARVRARLVAEHLGVSQDEVLAAVEQRASLGEAIDSLARGDHTLDPIEVDRSSVSAIWEPAQKVADPSEPMGMTRAFDDLLPEIATEDRRTGLMRLALPLCLLAAGWFALDSGALVRWWTGLPPLTQVLRDAPSSGAAHLAVLAAAFLGGLLFLPLELLVIVAAIALGALRGGALAFAGALAAAAVGYAIGRYVGMARIAPLVGKRSQRLLRVLRGRELASVAVLRIVSVASPMLAHVLCGAAKVPPGKYVLGTLIGFAPAVVLLSALGGLLRMTILDPGPRNAVLVVVVACVLAFAVLRSRRTLLGLHLDDDARAQEARSRFG